MILIHASEVAACVGRNPYKPRAELIASVLKRTDPAAFLRTGVELGEVVRARVVEAARSADPAVDAAVRVAEGRGDTATSASQVHVAVRAAHDAVEASGPGLDAASRGVLNRHCRDEAFKRFGTARELTSMAGLHDVLGTLTKDDVYRKRRVPGPIEVYVGGRVDGFATPPDGGPPVLVEIKNRMNRLFGRVVEYERLQISTYMFIFGHASAKLVERHDEEVRVHDVAFDSAAWDATSAELQAFAREVADLCAR